MKISRLKKYILGFLLIILLLVAGGICYVFIHKDQILSKALEEINKNLTAEVQVGSVDLSPVKNWPEVSIILRNVSISNQDNFKNKLLSGEIITVGFDLFSIIKGEYNIKSVKFEQVEINIERNRLGAMNYWIFQPRDTISNNAPNVSLDKIEIHNSRFNYFDYKGNSTRSINSSIFEANATLSLGYPNLEIELRCDNVLKKIIWDNFQFFKDFGNDLTVQLNIDREKKVLNIQKGKINSSAIKFQDLSGFISYGASSDFDLRFSTNSFNNKKIANQLSATINERIGNYAIDGNFELRGKISGDYFKTNNIKSNVTIKANNLSGFLPDKNLHFSELLVDGELFSTGFEINRSYLNNLTIHGNLEKEPFEASFPKLHLDGSLYRGVITGVVNREIFQSIYRDGGISSFEGSVAYQVDLQKRGQELIWDGEIELQSLGFFSEQLSHQFDNLNGVVLFNNQELAMQNVTGKIGRSDFDFTGLMINPSNILEPSKGPFMLSGEYSGSYLDLDELLLKSEDQSKVNSTNLPEIRDYTIPSNITIDLNLGVSALNYKKFKASNVQSRIRVKNQLISASNIRFNAIGGSVEGEIEMNTAADLIHCNASTKLQSLAIDSIFYIFDNFDQSFIQDKHLGGRITSSIQTDFYLTKNLTPIYPTFSANLSTNIRNGELIEFEPMYRLSKFIDVNELAHLQFQELRNNITIEDSKISIPTMEIRSNVSNIQLSGWHTFDQKIEYHLKVPLKKAYKRDKDERFGTVASNDDNLTNIFLKIEGTTDDYKISYDQLSAIKNLKEKITNEGQELIQSIKTKGESTNKKVTVELDTTNYFDFDDSVFETDSSEFEN